MTPPDFSALPFEVQERLAVRDAQYQAAYARGAATERLQAELTDVSATASSLRGEVKVTVSAAGLLTDLQIDARGIALGAAGLSRLVMTTLRDAFVQLEERVTDVVVDADAGDVGAALLAEVRQGLSGPLAALDTSGGGDLRLS